MRARRPAISCCDRPLTPTRFIRSQAIDPHCIIFLPRNASNSSGKYAPILPQRHSRLLRNLTPLQRFLEKARPPLTLGANGAFLPLLRDSAAFAHDETLPMQQVADSRAIVRQKPSNKARTTGTRHAASTRERAGASLPKTLMTLPPFCWSPRAAAAATEENYSRP